MTEDGAAEAAAEELAIADEELAVAEQLFASGHHRVAIARAYFALFHAIRARLYADGPPPQRWASSLSSRGTYVSAPRSTSSWINSIAPSLANCPTTA